MHGGLCFLLSGNGFIFLAKTGLYFSDFSINEIIKGRHAYNLHLTLNELGKESRQLTRIVLMLQPVGVCV